MRPNTRVPLRWVVLSMLLVGCLLSSAPAQAISTWTVDTYMNISFASANEIGLKADRVPN